MRAQALLPFLLVRGTGRSATAGLGVSLSLGLVLDLAFFAKEAAPHAAAAAFGANSSVSTLVSQQLCNSEEPVECPARMVTKLVSTTPTVYTTPSSTVSMAPLMTSAFNRNRKPSIDPKDAIDMLYQQPALDKPNRKQNFVVYMTRNIDIPCLPSCFEKHSDFWMDQNDNPGGLKETLRSRQNFEHRHITSLTVDEFCGAGEGPGGLDYRMRRAVQRYLSPRFRYQGIQRGHWSTWFSGGWYECYKQCASVSIHSECQANEFWARTWLFMNATCGSYSYGSNAQGLYAYKLSNQDTRSFNRSLVPGLNAKMCPEHKRNEGKNPWYYSKYHPLMVPLEENLPRPIQNASSASTVLSRVISSASAVSSRVVSSASTVSSRVVSSQGSLRSSCATVLPYPPR